ncbi:ATP-binding protein [Deinococcus multiflagellatus]|uniref:RNA-binding domain-containing protein n=1 Tax=Deinococcus multiflagellatus TaxID=1656887 RepID=A0ABW1ZQ69_9DEIO|nr:ATP-binding protein [Deinococcus multiflagellatus]MBZ9715509.1 ATP-binding protein [Deinococcus multiflagellatus]
MPPEALARYREILARGQETPKIDFKLQFNPEGDGLAEAVKDFCALANSFDPADPDQRQGLLFVGVRDDGGVQGLPDDFNHDTLTLRLTQRFERRVAPPMRFTVSPPILDEASGQSFAVIAIEPPVHLPHLAIQEVGRVQPGQWFVRRNSSTVLAGPEEFAELHRRLLAQEIHPMRSGLDRLAGELAVLREELGRTQARVGGGGSSVQPTDLADVPLAEAIRQEYAPKETLLLSRIRQLGRDLVARVLEIEAAHLTAGERITAEHFEAALTALEEAARPMAEVGFEISAYVDDARVWEAFALTMEDVVNAVVTGRVREDGALAPVLWFPFILCAYAAATAAVIHRRYHQLVPMLTGTYFQGKLPIMRAIRVLPRAEEWYRRATDSRQCAPLAIRAVNAMTGAAGWFAHRVPRDPEVTGRFAEIVLSLVWMATNSKLNPGDQAHPLPGAFLYEWRHGDALHRRVRQDRDELRSGFPNLPDLLRDFDKNASRYSEGGCMVHFHSQLANALTEP